MEQNSTDKTTLLQEATTLFLRAQECEDGTAVAEMEAWKSQSPQHRETMESVQSLWFAVDDLDDIPDVSIDDVRAAEQPSGLWARFSQYLTSPSVWPAMAAMVLAVGATLWLQLASQSPLPADPLDNRFSTRAAEHQLIRLPDGSELTMGAKSRVNTEYTDTLRRINLDGGEVLFSVAKDPKRPFVVTVNGVEVQAIGTVFNIWNDGANLEVSVLEGKVKVTAENSPLNGASADSAQQTRAGATVYLTQGQSIDHSPTGLGSVVDEDTYRSTAWSRGHLEFLSQDLERVIRDINRYTHRKIAIKDPRVASMQFSGTVDIQHVNEWLQGIEKVFPIETVHNNSGGLDIYLAEHALNGP